MNAITISFIFYLMIILVVGFYSVRITKNLKDFALGGQKLGPTVIAFSERASGESAWLLLGLPGAALILGMLELWTVLGCILGIIFSWLFIAYPLRKDVQKFDVITLPEYFEKKVFDESGMIRLISSLIITFFFTFYVAAQFSGAGKVLNVTFGITEFQGMLLGAIIIIFYTFMGGFLAVAWTDLVQGIIMIGTLIILPIVGWIELVSSDVTMNIDWSNLYGGNTGLVAITTMIGGLSWGLGYMGQPHLVARYMAIDKIENIIVSRKIAYAWAIPAFIGAMCIGLIGLELINNNLLEFNGIMINEVNQLPDPEKLMPIMAKSLLPAWLAGIFISGAIAAMMSTADSQLLISTTVITQDICKRMLMKNKSNEDLLTIGRIMTIIIGLVAFFMALETKNLVFEMVAYAWGGLGASFGPALILCLWWKKINSWGLIAGLIGGSFFTIFPIFADIISPRLSAFMLSTILILFVSKIKK